MQLHDDGVQAHAFVCDVADQSQVEQCFASSIDAAGGRIDSVFANAGRGGAGRPFVDLTYDDWVVEMKQLGPTPIAPNAFVADGEERAFSNAAAIRRRLFKA